MAKLCPDVYIEYEGFLNVTWAAESALALEGARSNTGTVPNNGEDSSSSNQRGARFSKQRRTSRQRAALLLLVHRAEVPVALVRGLLTAVDHAALTCGDWLLANT